MVFEGKWRCRAPSTKLTPLFNHAYVFTDECKHGVNVFAGLQRVRLRLTRKEATDRQQERQLRAINSACGSVRSRYCSNLARFRSDTRYRVLWCARDAATRKSRSTVWRNRNVGKFANEHWRLSAILRNGSYWNQRVRRVLWTCSKTSLRVTLCLAAENFRFNHRNFPNNVPSRRGAPAL